MKRILNLAFIALLLFSASFITVGCSDDDDTPTEKPEKGDIEIDLGGQIVKVPVEVLEKIQTIFSQASLGPQEVKTVSQLSTLTSICSGRKVDGPISVTPAVLNGEEITLVTLGGTEEKEGQATSMKESQLAAFGKSNDYLVAVTKLFENGTIPQDKPVIVTGISLGGMIAQQVLGQSSITENFTIRAIITFGAPITLPLDRKGVKVVRFADAHDKVPQLGESVLRMGMIPGLGMNKQELAAHLNDMDAKEKISRTSKYTGMIETHILSYIEDPCWEDVDFLGDSQKKNVLTLKQEMKFYPAPVQKAENN